MNKAIGELEQRLANLSQALASQADEDKSKIDWVAFNDNLQQIDECLHRTLTTNSLRQMTVTELEMVKNMRDFYRQLLVAAEHAKQRVSEELRKIKQRSHIQSTYGNSTI